MKKPIVTAIPLCCDRIAYHFAWCTHILLVETIDDKVVRQNKRPLPFVEAWDMARALVALGIDRLVCGAMPDYFRDWFASKGVDVIDCQRGAPQEILDRCKRRIREPECAGEAIDAD